MGNWAKIAVEFPRDPGFAGGKMGVSGVWARVVEDTD